MTSMRDLKVGRVRKVRFGSTQQSNPDPSAHLARLATHWPEATNSAAARGLTPSMLYMERRSNRILTNLRSSKLAVTVRAADDVQKNLVQSASNVNLEQIAWKTIACRYPVSINIGTRISLPDLFILYKLLSLQSIWRFQWD